MKDVMVTPTLPSAAASIRRPPLLTDLAKAGKGIASNSDIESAFRYTHDIFATAARDGLDIYMLTGSLREELRDSLYKKHTGRFFSDSVREVLKAGHNVSLFVWDDGKVQTMSPHCQMLLTEIESAPAGWGTLEIRASGTTANSDKVNHFLVAKNKEGTRWLLRAELPHPRMTETQLREANFEVRAAVIFDTEVARESGEPLLDTFHKLERAVPSR